VGTDVEHELEPARPHQRVVERLDEVGGPDDEHQLLLAEAVHLGEQLVDHRVLHAEPPSNRPRAPANESSSSNTITAGALCAPS